MNSKKRTRRGRVALLVLGGLVVIVGSSVALAQEVPVVGGWIGLVIALFGLGAMILEFWPRRRRAPEPAQVAA